MFFSIPDQLVIRPKVGPDEVPTPALPLRGKIVLIPGVANAASIAAGACRACKRLGATVIATYQNEKALRFVQQVVDEPERPIDVALPMDVTKPEDVQVVVAYIQAKYGVLHGMLHSIAYASQELLRGGIGECDWKAVSAAVQVSAWSFVELTKAVAPLMTEGGHVAAVSYYGSERIVGPYGPVMGPTKAFLEALRLPLASAYGPMGIRVNILSPGPIETRAGRGGFGNEFDVLLEHYDRHALTPGRVTPDEVGEMFAFLTSEGAKHITSEIVHIDGGESSVMIR